MHQTSSKKILAAHEIKSIELEFFKTHQIPMHVLMEIAAQAVARQIQFRKPKHVLIICGPGNNGADGFACARYLHLSGIIVNIYIAQTPTPHTNSLWDTQKQWIEALGVHVSTNKSQIKELILSADIVVDALFGTGLNRPITLDIQDVIQHINQLAKYCIAIDMPSGMGAPQSEPIMCVKAHQTVTFLAYKKEMLQLPARRYCGDIHWVNLGIPDSFFPSQTGIVIDSTWVHQHLKQQQINIEKAYPQGTHKGSFGHVLCVGGAPGYVGALLLAAQACYQSGAGLVTIAPIHTNTQPGTTIHAVPPEIMQCPVFLPNWHAQVNKWQHKKIIALGPGLDANDSAQQTFIQHMLTTLNPSVWVIDAGALQVLSQVPSLLKKTYSQPLILTPHPLEFSRLCGLSVDTIQHNRIETACEFARQHRVILVLKGAYTVIANPDGQYAINTSGSRALSKGGSGDILTGMIASFCAQGYDPFIACAVACFMHGLSGEIVARHKDASAVMASEIIQAIGLSYTELLRQHDEPFY